VQPGCPNRQNRRHGIAVVRSLDDAVALDRRTAMRDFELEAARRPMPPARDPAGPGREADRPPVPARSPALDAAAVMRLQRVAGNAGVVQLLGADEEPAAERSAVHDVVGSGGGAPLDDGLRSSMESAFGQSFEDVRVHTDARASTSAAEVGANAYTVGSDVVFRSGHFDPGTPTGQRTIAHELAHVVQQSQGPVDGTDAPGGIRVSDPSDRFERAADDTADEVMASVQSTRATAAPSASEAATSTAVQLDEAEDEEAPVQRETAPDEEDEEEAGAAG
jgi:uncharacterized protein DUF4157